MSLNVRFTTNQMCMKTYTPMYVAQTCEDHIYVMYVNFWELIIAFPNGGKWAP